jgi:hypothetical protein
MDISQENDLFLYLILDLSSNFLNILNSLNLLNGKNRLKSVFVCDLDWIELPSVVHPFGWGHNEKVLPKSASRLSVLPFCCSLIQASSIRFQQKVPHLCAGLFLVIWIGFEPMTLSLEG